MSSAAHSSHAPSSHVPAPHPVARTPALDEQTIERLLAACPVRDGGAWRVRVVDTTGSTSSDLSASIRAHGYRSPALLVAERQTAGRGRLGRTWMSTPGASLTASFALRIARPLSALDGVTLVCGLAARDAIAPHGVNARLKWPNDVLVDDRKLAGILVEALPVAGGTALVVGVGINVEPGEGAAGGGRGLAATDLRSAGGKRLDRNRLAAGFGIALRERLGTFAIDGFGASIDEWNRHDAFRDRPVTLEAAAGEPLSGIARGVDAGGALLLDTADGRRRIVSGDLSLRLAEAP